MVETSEELPSLSLGIGLYASKQEQWKWQNRPIFKIYLNVRCCCCASCCSYGIKELAHAVSYVHISYKEAWRELTNIELHLAVSLKELLHFSQTQTSCE